MLKKFVGVVSACCLFFSSLAGCTLNINIGNADENSVNKTNGKTIKVQDKIREEYSGTEYALSLEQTNETEIFTLIATSETPEYLEDMCNMAVSLLCEMIPQVIGGSSCKIVDCAKSAQAVGTN